MSVREDKKGELVLVFLQVSLQQFVWLRGREGQGEVDLRQRDASIEGLSLQTAETLFLLRPMSCALPSTMEAFIFSSRVEVSYRPSSPETPVS